MKRYIFLSQQCKCSTKLLSTYATKLKNLGEKMEREMNREIREETSAKIVKCKWSTIFDGLKQICL